MFIFICFCSFFCFWLNDPFGFIMQADGSQTCGSGRTLRDAAARAMQGWHSQRLFGNGEVGDAIIKAWKNFMVYICYLLLFFFLFPFLVIFSLLLVY